MPTVTSYLTIDGEVVAETRGGVDRDYLPDPLGSVQALLDANQAHSVQAEYWPYGEERSRSGTVPTPFLFVGSLGYRKDTPTSTYVRARNYRPNIARWQTVDPLWPGGRAYGYAKVNPSSYFDSSGKEPQSSRQKFPTNVSNCHEGERCLGILVRYSGGGRFDGTFTSCLHGQPGWLKAITDCACKYGVSPVALMATMYVETHYGTIGNSKERCMNPVGVHFCEKDSILSLRHADLSFPSLKESICKAASYLKRDSGFRVGVFGSTPDRTRDHQTQYELFVNQCGKRRLLGPK